MFTRIGIISPEGGCLTIFRGGSIMCSHYNHFRILKLRWLRTWMLLAALVTATGPRITCAQSLNWEGQDGIFVTPLAYVVPGTEKGFGMPAVAYHYVNAGSVLGGFHQVSISEGILNRIEVGYTRNFHQDGNTAGLSSLWGDGFNIFHGKVNALRESRGFRPAISVGFVARTQVHNIGGVLRKEDTSNADFYIVATKTVMAIRHLPLVFNAGFKATNASLLGLAGNAPAYQGRVFGAAAFALKGPGRSTILLGSEVLQQPRHVQDLPGVIIPTTITYAVRIVPGGALPLHGWGVESPKLTIDLGLLQAAGSIAPGVNLEARHQFALGISYGF
jgi:hypothetical protein